MDKSQRQQHDTSLDGINDDELEILTTGVGLVTHIRDFPEDGDKEPALYCNIVGLRGSKDDPYRTYYNCLVVDDGAQRLIRRCVAALEDEQSIVVRFALSNEYADTYTIQSGKRKGQPGAVIKARLVRIDTVDIDGERVHPAPASANGKSRGKDGSRSRAAHS